MSYATYHTRKLQAESWLWHRVKTKQNTVLCMMWMLHTGEKSSPSDLLCRWVGTCWKIYCIIFTDLLSAIPAKKDTSCLWHVLGFWWLIGLSASRATAYKTRMDASFLSPPVLCTVARWTSMHRFLSVTRPKVLEKNSYLKNHWIFSHQNLVRYT